MNTFKQNKILRAILSVVFGFSMLLVFSSLALAETSSHDQEMDAQMPMQMQEAEAGNYSMQLVGPEQIIAGENEFTVIITEDNQPAESLDVVVSAEMDKTDTSMNMSHGNEEAAIEQSLTQGNPGEYTGTLDLDGEGKWLLTVHFLDQEKTFDVMVEKSGPNLLVIGGFVGIILLIVIVAVVLKKKAPKEG